MRKFQVLTMCILFLMASCGGTKKDEAGNDIPLTSQEKGDALLKQAKTAGKIIAGALDQGIQLEATLAASGDIDADKEPQIRQWLKDAKVTIDAFNQRAQGYEHFDSKSKADIAKVAEDSVAFVQKLNQEGVLRIKNPRSRALATGIIAGAQVGVSIFKSIADAQAEEPAPAAS